MSSRESRISLLVRNLKYQTSPERVKEVFQNFGSVRDVYLPLDFGTRRPRGFGFVEFHEERDCQTAMEELDQSMLDGNRIEVSLAQRGRSSPDSMRRRDHPSSRGKFNRDPRGRRSPSRSRSRGRVPSRYGGSYNYRRRSPSWDRRRERSISRDRRRDRGGNRRYDDYYRDDRMAGMNYVNGRPDIRGGGDRYGPPPRDWGRRSRSPPPRWHGSGVRERMPIGKEPQSGGRNGMVGRDDECRPDLDADTTVVTDQKEDVAYVAPEVRSRGASRSRSPRC
eukprot:GHVQ01024364.1.p1 GENE.GHVQ01024364.1~~GHVQ01024364.1.p1  ORF type:complete len:279 (+),score=14.47 GHVQ01024364.1:207-1043(+)